jgi:hypothetical protein
VLPPPVTFIAPLRVSPVYDFPCLRLFPVPRECLRACSAPLSAFTNLSRATPCYLRVCPCTTVGVYELVLRHYARFLHVTLDPNNSTSPGTIIEGGPCLTVSKREDVVNCPKPCLKADRRMTILLILYFLRPWSLGLNHPNE